ncbi:MAG: hypothetical protein Q8L73_05560 [Methylotenera sp.]|nr:hypothetical protein [Methylotenera sp.]
MRLHTLPIGILTSIAFSFPTGVLAETKSEQLLLNKTIDAINVCYHYAGEIGDQSEERNKELERGIRRDCPKAKSLARQAFLKYPNNARLYEPILNLSDIGWFKLSADQKNKLCTSNTKNATCQIK